MYSSMIFFFLLWKGINSSEVYYYKPYNVTRSTISGIAEYRSALTLDWLEAEDHRQRELVAAFENEASPATNVVTSECILYAKPASGKVARLMLELLKNLEGDDGNIVNELIQSLIRAKMLVETSMLDAEPDLEALVKTPGVMAGEPHTTFPRILAMVWMVACDPTTVKKHGWCPITKVSKYLSISKPATVASHIRTLDSILARARFIMEEFIQHVTPLNVYDPRYDAHKDYRKNRKNKMGRRQKTTSRPPHIPMNKKHQRTPISVMEDPFENVAAYDQLKTPEAVLAVAAQGLSRPSYNNYKIIEKETTSEPPSTEQTSTASGTVEPHVVFEVLILKFVFFLY